MKILVVLFLSVLILEEIGGTRSEDNPYGLNLFLWLSGLDSLPDFQYNEGNSDYNEQIPCELCDNWDNQEKEKITFFSKMASTVTIAKTASKPCGMHTQRSKGTSTDKRTQRTFKGSPIIRSQSKEDDKLRKTKKSRKYHLSKQGQVIVKRMQHCSGDGGIYDVITHENCRLISFRQQKQNGLRTFDMRRDIIPENVMDALLCVKPNCADHLHKSVRKCGNKIICEAEAFGLENTDQQEMLPTKSDLNQYQDIENVCFNQESSNIDSESTENMFGDEDGYEEEQNYALGPPRASSSFIVDASASSSIYGENKTGMEIDPFSFLDDQEESRLKRFLDDSFSWFGGLYSYTSDRTITSFNNFRVDSLNESISKGLCDLERSFNSKEVQRNLSFYGNDTEPLFHFAFICLAQQLLQVTKSTWDNWRRSAQPSCSNCSNGDCDCNNNRHVSGMSLARGTELDSKGSGYAIYDATEYDSQ